MWCGLFHDMIIGPYFFNEATNSQGNFLNLLLQFAFQRVRDRQPGVILQLDGAPPHWGLGVRRSLHTEFPGRWIGRGEPYAWPPRSPDITPMGFFFCGFVKGEVYKRPINSINQLKRRFRVAVRMVTTAMLASSAVHYW